jgi:hypothetical protein
LKKEFHMEDGRNIVMRCISLKLLLGERRFIRIAESGIDGSNPAMLMGTEKGQDLA